MPKRKLTAYYHPTTVLFVDKERDHLLSLLAHLPHDLSYRLCENQSIALNFIEKSITEHSKKSYFHFEEMGEYPFVHHLISLNVEEVYREVFNAKRFHHVSALVLDLSEDDHSGLEICMKLKGTGIKIILLTDKSEEKIAISAFNQGLIHGYLSKRDLLALKGLGRQINLLQKSYFKENIGALLDSLPYRSYPFIHDEAFQDHFAEILENFGIVEYYLIEKPTGFLLFDKEGTAYTLTVLDSLNLTLQQELARDWGADEKVLHALENDEACLVIPEHVHKPNKASFGDWLRPVETVVGDDRVYYLAWQEGSRKSLDGSICHFAEHLKEFDFVDK